MTAKTSRESAILLMSGVTAGLFGLVLLAIAVADLAVGDDIETAWPGITAVTLGMVFLLIRRVDMIAERVRMLEAERRGPDADEVDAAWRDSLPDVTRERP